MFPWALQLPAVMREGLVGFRHAVRVLSFLDGAATQVRRVHELVGELLGHGLAVAALARVADQPADAERQAPVRIHFHGHLIVRAADAPRLHFERGLDVLDRLLEHLQRVVARLLLDRGERTVHDALGGAALAVAHQRADEFRHQRAAVQRIERNFTLRNFSTSWHCDLSEGRPEGLRYQKAGLRPALRFRPLGAVLRAPLLPALHAHRVERAAHDVVADAREVLHAAAANEHERVLLQVVADAGDVGGDLDPVGQADAGDLAKRRVRLLRRLREDADTDAALLRTVLQCRALGLPRDLFAPLAHELADRRHNRSRQITDTANAQRAPVGDRP